MGNCFRFFRSNTESLIDDEQIESFPEESFPRQSGGHGNGSSSAAMPVYHLHPGMSTLATDLDEEQQMQIAKRLDTIQFLPSSCYVPNDSGKMVECIICFHHLKRNDEVRHLPCLHTYHRACIDDWLMRSLICPSCLRPVELDLRSPSSKKKTTSSSDPSARRDGDDGNSSNSTLSEQLSSSCCSTKDA